MCKVVWKQAEINKLIKNIKCQPIHYIAMKAGEKSAQAMQKLLDSAEVPFYELPTSFWWLFLQCNLQRILNTDKDAHPQIPKHFSVLELNTFVKLKHIHQVQGFFTFALKYSSPSLLDPLWIWIFEAKSPVTAPYSDKMLPLQYQALGQV